MAGDGGHRRADLGGALTTIRARIAAACTAAGRDPGEVTLVAVTKTYPVSDVAALAELGILDIGESRDQEAAAKVAALAATAPHAAAQVRWHFVGQLQSRKARSVAGYASAVHSVDRPELVAKLAAAVTALGREPLDVFVQVSLDATPGRGGVPVEGLPALADDVAGAAGLRLRGLMAVAPLGGDADAAFARLAELAAQIRANHPDASAISAGMSDDFESAIRFGSTHVRVGSALLGRRSPVFG